MIIEDIQKWKWFLKQVNLFNEHIALEHKLSLLIFKQFSKSNSRCCTTKDILRENILMLYSNSYLAGTIISIPREIS